MSRFVHSIQALALMWGAPGILLVAFLDSSILSLPEIADLLVIYMVTRNHALFGLYVVSATLGSLAGCLALFYIGKKGGEALMRRRFHGRSHDEALDSAGRVRIPRHLIEHAGLEEGPCVVIGVADHLEIWNTSTWAEHDAEIDATAAEIAEELAGGAGR